MVLNLNMYCTEAVVVVQYIVQGAREVPLQSFSGHMTGIYEKLRENDFNIFDAYES